MNRRTVGCVFIAIAAFLYTARYITLACQVALRYVSTACLPLETTWASLWRQQVIGL